MKSLFFSLALAILVFSCSSNKGLSKEEEAKFSTQGYEILYEGKAVAKYDNKEYEYSNGKFQFEFSVVQYDPSNTALTEKMARFLAKKHPDCKIEIKLQNDIK